MPGIWLPNLHIPLPETMMLLVEKLQFAVTNFHSWALEAYQKATISPELYEHIKSNALLLLVVSMIFWPLLLSLLTAFTLFGTWIFWLLTSLLFGTLQLAFVIYNFVMIVVDILGLSLLKTYAILRTRALYYAGKSGTWSRKRSRRLVWRERLEAAKCYEDYLKISLQAHEPKAALVHKRTKSDPAIMRSASLENMEHVESPNRMSRNRSFSAIDASVSEDKSEQQVPNDPEVIEELGEMVAVMLMTTKERLKEARQTAIKHDNDIEAGSTLKQLLSGVVKRNHLNVDNRLIDNARSIATSGQYGVSSQSRKLIHSYFEEAEKGLDWIAEAPVPEENISPNSKRILEIDETPEGIDTAEFAKMRQRTAELNDRITLIRKIRANVGRTSLMLSGGGAQAMYHLGTLRALIEGNVYQDIKVISGTSGGSIAAAMCALKTPEELLRDVCVPTVSTDYLLTGKQKKKNIRWFPTVTDMAKTWLKTKLMVDSACFRRTCEFYYGDTTFEEAFERTGKHVCITVSASRASGDTAQRLLLNHISTPHVTLASAVAASCALPGVMAPAKLLSKNSSGVLEPFEVDGVEWIDGSVQADLPFQRIGTLFNVTNYIVCQTNFHVLPFLNKAHHPDKKSLYWKLFQNFEWDIRNRALQLSRLGLFPKMFGQDVSKIFKQKYHGNLTLVPRFTPAQTFGLKTLSNPSVEDMEGYLKYGQIATWPYLNVIRNMLRFEKSLDHCLSRLEERYRDLHPDIDWSAHDEIESIASASGSFHASNNTPNHRVRFGGHVVQERKAEKLRTKMINLEQENQKLKQQLQQMERLLALNGTKESLQQERDGGREEKNGLNEGNLAFTEGDVWNLVHSNITDS